MKKILLLWCLLISIYGTSQNKDQITNLTNFIKIWGFLKYYHHSVAAGQTDWDSVFMKRAPAVLNLSNKVQADKYYLDWVNTLGDVPECKSCKQLAKDAILYNLNLPSYDSSKTLSDELKEKLRFIEVNRYQGKLFYVDAVANVGNTVYKNEKRYEDSIFPSQSMRLLTLARYWNIVNYFFPYKYVTDQNWNEVLAEMTPKFLVVNDTLDYHLAILEMVAKIDDSHGGAYTKQTSDFFGLKWVPFLFKIIDGKAIVNRLLDEKKALSNDVKIGDVFLLVNDKPIKDILQNVLKYISASNNVTKLRNVQGYVFNGNADSVLVSFERDGHINAKYLKRYSWKDFEGDKANARPLVKIIPDNVGYVNMGVLERSNTDSVLNLVKNTKAIIFDVRNYPKGTMYKVATFLNPKAKEFVNFTKPDLSYPGTFESFPFYKLGMKNKNYYKGKVYVLFNETTQSHAEFTVMALQTAPDVTTIGSQTAGADGNVSEIVLPGNIVTAMTGIGVFYPDGRPTQRIGIVLDIEVYPTIKGIREGRDEVLERAIFEANKL